MTYRSLLLLLVLALLTLGVTACSTAPPAPTSTLAPSSGDNLTPASASTGDLIRTDAQGAVEFAVTPLNLDAPGETLGFEVSMNTHSVDLSWDLAAQSVLATDSGREVKGQSWPVGSGHHYTGTLTFPARTADGKALLDGAQTLTLTVRGAGAPVRAFVWSLSP